MLLGNRLASALGGTFSHGLKKLDRMSKEESRKKEINLRVA
jgi:hypothetical protein